MTSIVRPLTIASFAGAIVLAFVPEVFAQTGGMPVVEGPAPRSVATAYSDGAGGVSVAYLEDHRLFLRHVRANGALDVEWPTGILLATGPTASWFPVVRNGNGDDLYLAWVDDSLRVQRVDVPLGAITAGWPAAGRTLCAPVPGFAQFFSLQLGVDPANNARLFWDLNFDSGNNLAHGAVTPNGNVLEACAVFSACGGNPFVSNAVISGNEFVAGYSAFGFIGGEPAAEVGAHWSPSGVSHRPDETPGSAGLCFASGANHGAAYVAPSVAGDVILAFSEGDGSVSAQRLTPSPGSFLPGGEVWSDGGRTLFTSVADAGSAIASGSDGAGGAYFLYMRFAGGTFTLRLQAIRADGTIPAGWPSAGIVVASGTNSLGWGSVLDDGAGGVIVGWAERNGNDFSLHTQHYLGNGGIHPSWPVGGIEFATAPKSKYLIPAVTDGAGGAFFVWQDDRASRPDIYVQHVTFDGVLPTTIDVGTPPASRIALSPGRPNPTTDAIAFTLRLPEGARVQARVLDVAGRIVARLENRELPAGEHRIAWNGAGADGARARAGVYVLDVRTDDSVVTRRIVRL